MRTAPDLDVRFRDHLRRLDVPEGGAHLVLALSGGLDSVVLLHLLRFTPDLPPFRLTAAHLDHATRPSSATDADWCRGLTRAWDVRLVRERLTGPPANEARARTLRYRFLERVREEASADWILTAHHADDQAETVLFRAFRGTGLSGISGMAAIRGGAHLFRPLLPFWREELETYARSRALSWRTDPTNRSLRHARNVLRHQVLPRVEEEVAPGARRALVRLARLARRSEAGWRALLAPVLDEVVEDVAPGRIVVVRPRLLAYHPEVRRRVLRTLAHQLGGRLDEAGTRGGMQFSSSGASGQRISLTGGLVLRRDFDRLVMLGPDGSDAQEDPAGRNVPLRIDDADEGGGRLALGSRRWDVHWSAGNRRSGRWVEDFALVRLDFPLRLRGWQPGDRIRLPFGSKKLTKLYGEHRVPVEVRRRRPLLEDRNGRILWVPGIARASGLEPTPRDQWARDTFTIAIDDADQD